MDDGSTQELRLPVGLTFLVPRVTCAMSRATADTNKVPRYLAHRYSRVLPNYIITYVNRFPILSYLGLHKHEIDSSTFSPSSMSYFNNDEISSHR